MIKIHQNDIYLTCKGVIFYSNKDEDAFFEWIKKIECIEKFDAAGDELYLDIAHDHDLRDLIALLYRYRIDMKQLQQFLTDDNRKWFFEKNNMYWHNDVWGN